MLPKDCIGMRIESGTCNVCAAPCSSCMHYNLSMSAIGSNNESYFSHNFCVGREADSSSVMEGMPIYKSRILDDLQHAASETSNLISISSSHDSYSENAESKRNIGASAACDASDDVDMSQVLSPGEELEEERPLKRNLDQGHCIPHSRMPSHLGNRFTLGQGEEQSGLHCNVDNVIPTFDGSSSEHKSSALQNHKVSTISQTRGGIFSGKSNVDDMCQDAKTGIQCEKSFDNVSKEVHLNDPVERDGAVLGATKVQGNHMPTQETTEGENSESDLVLHDVKVCDICGDAGREDLLAICSKCSDGAEHTYCMRVKLDKVPEGDWLCEECKIREIENQNVDECEAISGRLKSTRLNEISQKSIKTLIPKQLSKVDTRPTDLGFSKGLQSPGISTRRLADDVDDRKFSEPSGVSQESASPRKKPVLSRQISLKNQDMGKVITTSMAMSSEGQSAKCSDTFSRSKMYLSSSSFKGQSPHSSRGLLSRSVSFSCSSINPKFKTLIENAPPKKKMVESTNNDPRKEGLARSLTKSTFKNTTSGRSNADSASKDSSLQLSRIEDLRALKEVKERNNVDRKNFSATGNSLFRPTAAIASNFPLKRAKSVQSDKLSSLSAASVRSLNKGFNDSDNNDADDLGSNQMKHQISNSFKNIGPSNSNSSVDIPKKSTASNEVIQISISNLDGLYSKGETVSPSSVVQPSESEHKDDRVRDFTISGSSSVSAFGTDQMSFCQKFNEAGHVSQHCSVDKLRGSARKLAAEQNLGEAVAKGNKWREVVNAAMSGSGMLKRKICDMLEDLPAASADMNCKAGSEYLPSAFIRKNSSSVVENSNDDSNVIATRRLATTVSGQSAGYPVKVSHVPNADRLSDCPTLTELSMKRFAETLRAEASRLVNSLRASAIPKLECIWQGSFNVLGTGSPPKKIDGFQAHLSTCASHRVFEVATKVPGNVQLEEVSYTSSLAQQFHGICPQEENIALFFFAKDVDSYERSYRKLMDWMHRNDLVLRGDIDGTELLILTSNKLSMNCQRWNRMYYLWGMFRGKRRYCLSMVGDQEKSSVFNSDMELLNTDLNIPPIFHVPNVENLESNSKLKRISESTSLSMIPGELINGVDLQPKASDVKEKACRILSASLAQNALNQVVPDPKVSRGQPLFCIGNSSESTAEPLRVIDAQKVMHRMPTSISFFKEESDGTCQENCTSRSGHSPAVACDVGVEYSLRRASSVPPVYPLSNQGVECSSIAKIMKGKESSQSCVAIIDDHPRGNTLESDPLSCESRAHRKCELSCSIEKVPQPFEEMSNKADETLQLRERPTWMPIDDKREQNCYASGSSITEDNASVRFSPKVHPLHSSNLSQLQQGELNCSESLMPECLRTAEASYFPMDFGPLQNNKGTNILHILSSDEEDTPESRSPDLELALGGKKKSKNAVESQSLYTSVDKSKLHMQPVCSGNNDGDDESALLSLSLGFPASERERSARSVLKTEQILPERPSGDASLFLFSIRNL